MQQNLYDSNTDGSFTVADSNAFFESLGNSSDNSKQIFRGIVGKFSYFIILHELIRIASSRRF